jgi:uncharacterized damage-inducible protein DinB
MLIERFRHWYEHERDSNAKMLAMLESVPENMRTSPEFTKALEKSSHIALARQLWLCRMGQYTDVPPALFPAMPIEEQKKLFAHVESLWTKYLATLTDADLEKKFEYVRQGVKLRYSIEGALTQTHGHAWYHRGQVGMLVAKLGGKFMDTDFVFWHHPEKV